MKGQTENTIDLWKITFLVVKNINRPTRNKFGEFSKNIRQTHIELANLKEDKYGKSSTQLIEVWQKRKQRNLRGN